MIQPICQSSPFPSQRGPQKGTHKSQQTSSSGSSVIITTILECSCIFSNDINSLFLEIFGCVGQDLVKGFEGVSEYSGIADSGSSFLVSASVYC